MTDPNLIPTNTIIQGGILHCDRSGKILGILLDNGLVTESDHELGDLVDPASITKMDSFLKSIEIDGFALNWEINYPVEGKIRILLTSGLRYGDQILVLITPQLEAVRILLEVNLNREPELRASLGDLNPTVFSSLDAGITPDQGIMDELSKINNELVSLQREVIQQKVELEVLNDLKTHFLGLAAHDLRNPLAVILSYTEFLQEDLGESISQDQNEFLKIIESSSSYMLALVEDLLDVSTISQGRMVLDRSLVPVIPLLREVCKVNKLLARNKGIDLELSSTLPEGLSYDLDRTKFTQVMHNLISNALKYSPSRTRVAVRGFLENGSLCVEVGDQGPGIPAPELEKIFDLYQKTSVVSPAGDKSTGLGLAIAKNIITAHGGELAVESQVGEGTTFTVSLPLNPPPSATGRNHE